MLPSDPLIDRSSCLAVVPAYNEAATVGGVVSAIQRKAPQLDVLVIDDGSTDSTGACAEQAGARVLRLPFNLGIGGAVQAGSSSRTSTATATRSRSTATASTIRARSASSSTRWQPTART
jgi:cellulose synthase/poly-beta-1,6-N-acetylglucosamine synthase-like glycosyltransferase